MKDKITRRDFMKGAAGAAAMAVASGADAAEPGSVVAVARAADALDAELKVNRKVAEGLVTQAVASATGTKGDAAWSKLFKASDVIGIMTTKHLNATHLELADIVATKLKAAGVPEASILYPQRSIDEVKRCTALIALPALKAHWLTGLGTVLKLYITLSGNPSAYHNENSTKLGEIWNLEFVKGKTRLVLIDALRPLCDKGPQPDPRYMWNYGGIIASTDPVAAEAVALKIIQAKRDEIKGEPWPLSPPALCLEAADKQYKLGTSNLAKVKIVKLGTKEGALV